MRTLSDALAACPLVAILRGIAPDEIGAVADILIDAGFAMLEVPLNSPDPYRSIERLAAVAGDAALAGAGTVTDPEQVRRVRDAGGRLIVAPNTDAQVIRAAVDAGMIALPGFATPSEAFAALRAGAHGLKLFPADGIAPVALRALRSVLPREAPVLVVGGITAATIPAWREAGASGFGVGSHLYRPGVSHDILRRTAHALVAAARTTREPADAT